MAKIISILIFPVATLLYAYYKQSEVSFKFALVISLLVFICSIIGVRLKWKYFNNIDHKWIIYLSLLGIIGVDVFYIYLECVLTVR